MPIEATGKVATGAIDALRSQPLALALILINLAFLAFGGWTLKLVADRSAARDTALIKLADRDCK
jgi:hypothetical protein